jgi:hypothetical protein
MYAAGHNLESTWLVADTLDYLLAIHAINPATATRYRATAMDIGAAAVQQGYDAVHGGVFESGLPGQAPNSTLKVWWVQMESVMALYKLYQHSGDVGYLQKLAQSTGFVRQHVLDSTYGEMYWQVRGLIRAACRNQLAVAAAACSFRQAYDCRCRVAYGVACLGCQQHLEHSLQLLLLLEQCRPLQETSVAAILFQLRGVAAGGG